MKRKECNYKVSDTFMDEINIDFEKYGENYDVTLSYVKDPEKINSSIKFTEYDVELLTKRFNGCPNYAMEHIMLQFAEKFSEIAELGTNGDFFLYENEECDEVGSLANHLVAMAVYPGFCEAEKKVKVDFNLSFDEVTIFYPDGSIIATGNDVLSIDDVRRQIYEKGIPGCYARSKQHPEVTFHFDTDENWPFQHQHTDIVADIIKLKEEYLKKNK